MNIPASSQHPTAAEQSVILAARASRDRCVCGEVHEDPGDGVTPAVIARMRGYLAANPGHRFAVDDDAGIVAVITGHDPASPGTPEILAWSGDLIALLDSVDAPSTAGMS